jgi:amino acid transporter
MDSFGLIMGIVVMAMGIVYLFMGMSGKWVFLKKRADESTEEIKEKKTQQVRRRYRIVGVIGIIIGITAVLISTLWK